MGNMVHVGETNSPNRELTSVHGSAILSGQLTRENTMRDVLEMVTTCRDVEYGIFRILAKGLRGYFGISRGAIIVGAHTTSTREYGIPALRELLSAVSGMFVFGKLDEFPIEIRQGLSIPLNEMLEWRPEGVPPNMVILLPQALAPWEQRQTALEESECMDALRLGTMPAPVDAEQEEASFLAFWGGKQPDEINVPAKPLSVLVPKAEAQKPQPSPLAITVEIVPPPSADLPPDDAPVREEVAATWMPQPRGNTPQQPFPSMPAPQEEQTDEEYWSKSELDAIGRAPAQVEEVKTGLAHSGRYKAADADDMQSRSGRFVRDELTQSQRVHRPDPELSASGRFIAAEVAAAGELLPKGNIRDYMEVEEKVSTPIDPVLIACLVVSFLVLGWMGFQIFTYMSGSAPSPLNRAVSEIRAGQIDAAIKNLDEVLKSAPNNQSAKLALAVAFVEQKKYEDAIAKCDEILKDDPNAADALRTRAVANAQLEKYDEAIADIGTYLSAAKDDEPAARALALATRAYANMKLKRYDNAIADYSKAIKLDEKNMHLFASRAAVNLMKQAKK